MRSSFACKFCNLSFFLAMVVIVFENLPPVLWTVCFRFMVDWMERLGIHSAKLNETPCRNEKASYIPYTTEHKYKISPRSERVHYLYLLVPHRCMIVAKYIPLVYYFDLTD